MVIASFFFRYSFACFLRLRSCFCTCCFIGCCRLSLFFLFLAAVVDALTTPSSLYLNVFNFFFRKSFLFSLFIYPERREKKTAWNFRFSIPKKKGTHQHALERGIRSVCRRVQSRCSANVAISHAIMGSSPVVTAATLDCLVCVRREEVAGSKHGRVEGRRLCGARGSKVGLRG